ncbi:hypothetical protein P3S68_026954 [Capsicum galapagoense]
MDEAITRKRKRKLTKKFVTNQTDVSFMLTKHVLSEEVKGDSNLVLSPLSIQVVLALIATGSKGPTRDQLVQFYPLLTVFG